MRDVNGDGRQDVIALECGTQSCLSGAVSVFISNADGTLQAPITSYTSVPGYYLAVGDLNGDGLWDVAMSDGYLVSTAIGNGNGTFTDEGAYVAGYGVRSVVLADANQDLKDDLLLPESCDGVACSSGGVEVLLSDGSGHFPAPPGFEVSISQGN